MISVANDLLNNSLGLFEQMEKAKHEHRRVLTLAHKLVYMYFLPPYAFIQMYAPLVSFPSHLRRRHLGCFKSAPPLFPDSAWSPAHCHSTEKVARNSLSAPFLAIGADSVAFRLSPDRYLGYRINANKNFNAAVKLLFSLFASSSDPLSSYIFEGKGFLSAFNF